MGADASALGAVMQLNMGEGKTRIILPLLVLALGGGEGGVVRLNFVGELLPDAVAYLHRTLTGARQCCCLMHLLACITRLSYCMFIALTVWLCARALEHAPESALHWQQLQTTAAQTLVCMWPCDRSKTSAGSQCAGSLLKVPVCVMPFTRDVAMTETRAARMHLQLRRCHAAGGALCIAREHRASLLLKQQVQLSPARIADSDLVLHRLHHTLRCVTLCWTPANLLHQRVCMPSLSVGHSTCT